MDLNTLISQQRSITPEYRARLKHYLCMTLLSELSKLLFMGIFFALVGSFSEFLCAAALLFLLRHYSGGMHFQTYAGCFLASFLYMALCILFLPNLLLSRRIQTALLITAAVLLYRYSPVPSPYHARLTKAQKQRYRTAVSSVTALYAIVAAFFFGRPAISVGVWVILLHTIQLLTEYRKRRCEQ